MGAFASFKSLFTRASSVAAQFDNPFLQIDTSVVAREMRLEERGKENGLMNHPTSDSTAMDPVEREVIGRVEGVARHAEQDAAAQFHAYDERISGLGLLSQIPDISVAATQATSEMQAAVARANLRLTNARANVSQSYEQLRAFRSQHGLTGPAQLDRPFIATTGAIALSLVLETVANSLLLRQNDDMGLLGGVVAAATVGAINIGTAAFVGRVVFPRTNLKGAERAIGLAGTTLWILFTIIWNFGAAHYRDAKVAGLANPESAALDLFWTMPASIYSWGLFLAGILFSVVAARAAYAMDDPFPEYGRVSREHQSRCSDYAGEVEDATIDLTEIRDEAIEEASDVRRELATQLSDRDRATNGRNAFIQRYNRFHAELESAANQLLTVYRTANRRARTEPPPRYFDDVYRLPDLAPPPPMPSLQVTPEMVKNADGALLEAVERISAVYLEGVHQFETLEALEARLLRG